MGAPTSELSDIPRQVLRDVVSRYGRDIVDDPRRCRALLLDLAGQHRREISVLVAAQEELVADDLSDIPDSVPLSLRLAQLTRRLVDNRALEEQAARWAVLSWAYALGLPVEGAGQPADHLEPHRGEFSTGSRSSVVGAGASPISPTPHEEPGTYASRLTAEVFGRPNGFPDAPWDALGRTPGRIRIPEDLELRFRLTAPDDLLLEWVSQLREPGRVTDLDVLGACSDVGLSALGPLSYLRRLSVANAERVTDAGMETCAALGRLQVLSVAWGTSVTDSGIASLAGLQAMTSLNLSRVRLTDAGLAAFRGMSALETLVLRECHWIAGTGFAGLRSLGRMAVLILAGDVELTDAGVASIAELSSLRRLDLARCVRVSAQGMVHLSRLPRLEYLDLSWNLRVDDRALLGLRGLSSLSALNLAHTAVGDADLRPLGDLKGLRYLDLAGCDTLTDRCLTVLVGLPQLAYVSLVGCPGISRRAISTLGRAGLSIDL